MNVTAGSHAGDLKRQTLAEQVVEWLADRIISGEYPPRAALPETEIAESLGCSRSPLREALRILAQEGLVEIRPGRGASVTPLDPKAAAEFYDTRALLESQATRLATEVITEPQMRALEASLASLREAERSGDISLYQDRNGQLHMTLYGFCPNQTLVDLVRMIWRRSLRYGQLLRRDPKRLTASVERKRKLLDRIAARDAAGAARAMEAIVLNGKADVLEALTEGADDPYAYWLRHAAKAAD